GFAPLDHGPETILGHRLRTAVGGRDEHAGPGAVVVEKRAAPTAGEAERTRRPVGVEEADHPALIDPPGADEGGVLLQVVEPAVRRHPLGPCNLVGAAVDVAAR